ERADDAARGERDSDAAPRGDGVGDRQRPPVLARRDASARRGPGGVRLIRSMGFAARQVGPRAHRENYDGSFKRERSYPRYLIDVDHGSPRCLNVKAEGDVESV